MLFNAYYKNAIQVIVKSLFEPDSKKHAYSVLGVPFCGPVKSPTERGHIWANIHHGLSDSVPRR